MDANKIKYAKGLKAGRDPMELAIAIFPNDISVATRIANEWPKDPEVLDAMKNADDNSLPASKQEIMEHLWGEIQGRRSITGRLIPPDYDDSAKLIRLYAEIGGMIEKPEPIKIDNHIELPKVIEVPMIPPMDDWEAAAIAQQKELKS